MRFSRRRSRAAVTSLVVCAVALLAALGSYLRTPFSVPLDKDIRRAADMDLAELQRQYTGTIMIPDGIIGRCRTLKFDNVSGAITPGGTGPCYGDSLAVTSGESRVNAIRDSFIQR